MNTTLTLDPPPWSSRLNAGFELDDTSWESQFTDDDGPHATVGDLFHRIGLDEREHEDASVAHVTHPPFGRRPRRPSPPPAATRHSPVKENLR